MSGSDVVKLAAEVQGLIDLVHAAGIALDAEPPLLASGIDFVLEGLYAMKRISRSEERGYHASETPVRKPTRESAALQDPPMPTAPGSKKKYYN